MMNKLLQTIITAMSLLLLPLGIVGAQAAEVPKDQLTAKYGFSVPQSALDAGDRAASHEVEGVQVARRGRRAGRIVGGIIAAGVAAAIISSAARAHDRRRYHRRSYRRTNWRRKCRRWARRCDRGWDRACYRWERHCS